MKLFAFSVFIFIFGLGLMWIGTSIVAVKTNTGCILIIIGILLTLPYAIKNFKIK